MNQLFEFLTKNPDAANALATIASTVVAAVALFLSLLSLYVAHSTLTTCQEEIMDDLQASRRTFRNICTECSLNELNQIIREVEGATETAIQFLARPRTFFHERGFYIPLEARITITPTEELRSRLLTPRGLERFLQEEQQNPGQARIKIHVKDGLAKCVKVEFE